MSSKIDQWDQNKYYKRLKDHLKTLHWDPKQAPTIEEVVEYLENGKPAKRSKWVNFLCHFPKEVTAENPQSPFPIWLIRALYAGFKIDPNDFLLSKKEIKAFKNAGNKVTKRHFTNIDYVISMYSPKDTLKKILKLTSDHETQEERDSFVQEYVGGIKPYIDNSEKAIYSFEFLGKGYREDMNQHLEAYHEAHNQLFEAIEKRLESEEDDNQPINEYLRILTLSTEQLGNSKSNEDYLKSSIKFMSFVTFSHIARCLEKYPSASFCVKNSVYRNVHFGVIYLSNSKIIYSEYYKVGKDMKTLLPDVAFIEECIPGRSEVEKLLNVYKEEIRKYQNGRNRAFRLTLENFKDLTLKVREDLKHNGRGNLIEGIEDKISYLNGHHFEGIKSIPFTKINRAFENKQ